MHRRGVLRALVAVGGTGALAACLDAASDEPIPSGDPDRRPARQHAWNDRLRTDEHGNHLLPHHHVFLSLDYAGGDPPADRADLEAALVDLERAYEASHRGLLFTVGYAPTYFDRFDAAPDADLPPAGPILPDENVAVDDADVFVHLASDRAAAVLGAEAALLGDGGDPIEDEAANGVAVTPVDGFLEVTERRTGFFGPGLPAERDRNLQGLPRDAVDEEAPTFMNFRSGLRRTQATEDGVTIREGRFSGGTTQHVEILRLLLSEWFDHDTDEQVARLFSPALDAGAVGPVGEQLTDHNRVDGGTDEDLLRTARDHGVVGHAGKLARHREDGRPPILRRDVNSDDHGEAGTVFVSLQRSFETFRRLRTAMEGTELAGEGDVGERRNNGILDYIRTRRRGTFLIPPREARALPL